MNFEVWISKFEFRSLNFEVWISKFEFRSLNFKVWISKFEFQSLNFKVWSSKYRQNSIKFRYDTGSIISISNFDTIFDIDCILYRFRYVRNFWFDMHVLSASMLEPLFFILPFHAKLAARVSILLPKFASKHFIHLLKFCLIVY